MADVWDLAPATDANVWDAAPAVGQTPVTGRRAKDLGDAIIAGMQNSATGLALRGKLPSMELGEDAPWYQRLAANTTAVATDLPLSAVGFVGGAAAGGAVGTAVAGPGGTVVGGVVGGGAGAFAAPMALRDALIEAYSNNHALSWSGAWDIALAGLKGGAKGAVIGGATAGAGGLAARAVGPTVAGAVGTSITGTTAGRVLEGAALGSELATLTATSAALEGKLPTWQDFMDNAVLLGGMKAAGVVANNMRNIYAETGRTPERVLADAAKDPALKEQLSKPGEIPEAYKPLALEERIKAAIDADPRPEAIRQGLKVGAEDAPKLGEPPIADPVKYEYITDNDTAKGVLRYVSDMYQTEIAQQTRGVVTNKATAVQGLKMISDGVIGEHLVGDAANASEIYARAHLLRGATNHAFEKLKALSGTPEADITPAMKLESLAALERVSMLKAEIEGVGAEAGRALQIFRAIKRDPSFLGEADSLLAVAERNGRLQDIAKVVADLKDPAQLASLARQYTAATPLQKMLYGWRAFILSGPQTHLANILGNVTKWGIEIPESAIAATIEAGQRAVKGDPLTMAQYKARALAPLYGLQHGSREALLTAAEVWKGQGQRVEKAEVQGRPIEGRAGDVLELPFKALQVEDALFRTVAERGEAYKLAVDRAVKEGLHPETKEFREAVVKYTERPDLGLPAAQGEAIIKRIEDAGAEAVFSQRLGPFLEMVQAAMQKHAPAMSFIVPFIRTPANLVSWAVQHVPGLNLLSGRWREDFAAGGERQARATARVVVGTGLTLTAFSMTQNGTLTGGGQFDKEQGAAKRAAGWQPYSLKIGDTYYSYQRFEPVAKVLGIAADLSEMLNSKKLEEADAAKVTAMLVAMFGNATVSTTYLSGLSNAIQSVNDPERYAGNFVEQYASSVVPKIVGQTAQMIDPHKREVDGVMEAIQSQIPYFREKLMPKRDVWGEPMKNDRWFDVMPVSTTEASHDKVKTEAVRLQLAITDAPKFLLEKGPFGPKERQVKLDAQQRDVIREVSGKNAATILAPIVNAPDWERIPDFAKVEIYKHVIEGTRKQGAYAALPPDDAARAQVRQKIVDRIIQQTKEAQSR